MAIGQADPFVDAAYAAMQPDGEAPAEPMEPPPEPEPPYDYKRDYWLAFPWESAEYAQEVMERFRAGIEFWDNSAVGWTCWQAYRAYHNINAGPDAAAPMTQLAASGEMGELLAMAVPLYRQAVKHLIALFTSERPAWDPIARTTDAEASEQVPAAGNMLDHVASSGILDECLQEQTEMMCVTGTGYYVTDWDVNAGPDAQGWFKEQVFAPWECVHEPVRRYQDAAWHIFETIESRWDWVAHFASADPDKAKLIADHDDGNENVIDDLYVDQSSHSHNNSKDRIRVKNVFAKPTLACPQGRYSKVLSNDVVLIDTPFPYGKEVTISRMCASQFLGTSIPYADSWGGLAASEAYNAILSMVITRVDTGGVPNFCLPEGSELDFEDLVGGNRVWRVPPGSAKPEVVDLLRIDPGMDAVMERLKAEIDSALGINSVIRGQPQENVSSGSMAALMQTMAQEFNSNLERAWILNLERVGTHHVNVFRAMASEELAIEICGDDSKWTVKKLKGQDLNKISRIAVKTTNGILKTKAGKADIADRLYQKGDIEPEELMAVVQTGQLDRLFAGPVGKVKNTKAENEALSRGEKVMALMAEDHPFHIKEHMQLLTTDARRDPALVQNIMAHIIGNPEEKDELTGQVIKPASGHYSLWAKMSREQPDLCVAMGFAPLPDALAMHQQQVAMLSMGMGLPPPEPASHGPGPGRQEQPNEEPTKEQPGPKAAPPGHEPSSSAPSEPKQPAQPDNPSVPAPAKAPAASKAP